MLSTALPSTPDRSTAVISGTPPPIPFSTHPRYSPLLGNIMNPLHSRMDGETQVGHSGSEPPPILVSTQPSRPQTDDHTTVSIGEGLNRNPTDGNPTQQCSFPVSPSSTAARWNPLSQASPSCPSRSGRYQHYVITVGKRTGVFADWYVRHDSCMIFLSTASGAMSAALLKAYRWPVRRDFVPTEKQSIIMNAPKQLAWYGLQDVNMEMMSYLGHRVRPCSS